MARRWLRALALAAVCASALSPVRAQAQAGGDNSAGVESEAESPAAESPGAVDVRPGADDEAIRARLERILRATGWFEQPSVRVLEGIVFLGGTAASEQRKLWAGDLARKTEDVVAVVNQMEPSQRPVWDLGPAFHQLRELIARVISGLPGVGFAIIVLLVTLFLSRGVRLAIAWIAGRRVQTPLLRRMVARAGGIFVVLFGVYIVLYVSGLTRLAVTVLGGTGLVGLVVGVAFRDITENFLASVFLSVQRPFRVDDLVEIAGVTGLVQRTTFRTTVLLTLDGNHVQVPNSTVYKAVIHNFTSNPNRREHFDVGIGYDVAISRAQEVARSVLGSHPAVLDEPEPWVLVHALGSSSVTLRIYFWLDGTQHSWLKVRSSVIRLIKGAFQDAGIDMPDEAREVVFPEGLPLRMQSAEEAETAARPSQTADKKESREVATSGESLLATEAGELKQQAERSRSPEEGENLLR